MAGRGKKKGKKDGTTSETTQQGAEQSQGQGPSRSDKPKKQSPAQPTSNETQVVSMTLSELKSMMHSIAVDVFDEKKEKLKFDIEDDCEYQVYIQSVEIEQTFDKFKEELKQRGETAELKKVVKEQCIDILNAENQMMKKEMRDMKEEINSMKTENKRLRRKLEKLDFQLHSRAEKSEELRIKVDEIEQKQLERNVRIVGLPEDHEGNSDLVNIQKLARKELDVNLKQSDITDIYRVGKKNDKKKHRDTIIKFKQKTVRDEFYQSRKNMVYKEDQDQIYINEHLTENRANVFFAARKLVKGKRLHSAWSQRGNIMIRESEGHQPRQVRSHEELRKYGYAADESDYLTPGTDVDSADED